jgi:hypothetical protein
LSTRKRKKRQSPAARSNPLIAPVAGDAAAVVSPTSPTADVAPVPSWRWPLWAAATIAAAWLAALVVMAARTANPVTLNRAQLAKAEFVATAKVVDRARGAVEVEDQWKNKAPVSLTLENLAQTSAVDGQKYLIPISKAADGFRVTGSRLPNDAPLIYPATSESIDQLRQILDEHAP